MVRVGGRVAWPVCVVSLSLVAVGAVLALGNGTDARALGHLPFVAVCAVVAAVIETGRPGNAVGRLLALGGFSFALMEACGEYALYRPGTALGTVLAWPQTWLWVPANTAFALIPPLLPDGRAPSRRWRPVVIAVVAAAGVTAMLGSLRPGVNTQVGAGVVNPLGVPALAGAAAVAEAAFTALLGVVFAGGAIPLVVRAVRATPPSGAGCGGSPTSRRSTPPSWPGGSPPGWPTAIPGRCGRAAAMCGSSPGPSAWHWCPWRSARPCCASVPCSR
ncbi:hypothetical protein GCM10010106_16930 [Thermopolyspora flexuosa]|uniref:Uncharacterized protein n=1 Tax=Thermopolyspora flexuosa TaxID=103836 RepID=A0A543J4L9_9ACTN|nr:hypothetical protein [Thermopolyspora flexuosa]TQM77718.1 hypothetical protein FHX40_4489 [Thermopolyspora flexuosa]GGM71185.1 hypothetical protein GCM10010106_16930 [Thermopolyspora flexuosa]